MPRKIAVILAAIIVPGGFIALFGAWLLRTLGQTPRGKQVLAVAYARVPQWATSFRPGSRQAA